MRLHEIQYAREIDRLKRGGRLPTIDELCRAVLAAHRKYNYRIMRARREQTELQRELFQ